MALKNQSGNYLKITAAQLTDRGEAHISWDIYASETLRKNGLGEFDSVQRGSQILPYDGELSGKVRDALLKVGYELLKADTFNGWGDC